MKYLEQKAREIRRKTLDLAIEYGDSHLASALSTIDILTVLYYDVLTEKDKFILSKGHACFGLYTVLRDKGYNPTISGHPDIDEKNDIHCTTGSLGHGLPICSGMAHARKMKNKKGRIYVLMSDGECQEGTLWEASNIINMYKLDNLVAIVDYNKLQALDKIENVLSLGDLKKKFKVMGWYTSEVNGHDVEELSRELKIKIDGLPRAIIANTVKGKGISFMENTPKWQTRKLKGKEIEQAYEELK